MGWLRRAVHKDAKDDVVVVTGYVVEPEIDMRRPTCCRSPVVENLSRVLRWLTPETGLVRAPMRSVARELEEFFPQDHN